MGIQVLLKHRTSYKYDRPITLGPQTVRLRPAAHCRTRILSYALRVSPANHALYWQQDALNNHLARLLFPEKTAEFTVDVELAADLVAINPFDFVLDPGITEHPFQYPPDIAKDLLPYLTPEAPGPLLQGFLATVSREKRGTVGFLLELNSKVNSEIGYRTRMTAGVQSCEQTLELKTGSCRDSAWLLVQIFRHMGVAARFASGYLIQLASDQEHGHSQDSADLHAWAEAFLPGAGWVGFDATSGLLAGEGHIPLACTPDATQAAPVSGTLEPSKVDFSFSLTLERINDEMLPASAYSAEQWHKVEELAHQVDADLLAHDVRLTMGGEPTFVGIDQPESPQWNGDAMGPLKRTRAITLIRSIAGRIAPGSLLHFGQGKWYPGELLPRWAMGCYWRADGVPIWEKPRFIAPENEEYGFDQEDARDFMDALAHRLQVSPKNILTAYEDAFYYVWRERRLPVNVDTLDSKLTDLQERSELARVFERGLMEPVGFVLPIRRRQHDGRLYWSSQPWFLRPERLLLMQGDSPVGYRLPLDSLPWVAPDDIEYDYDADPMGDREQLPGRPARDKNLFGQEPPEDPQPAEPQVGESAKGMIRPALCVEAREGRVHVFLPYTPNLPDYLDLLTAVEDTCEYLEQPVWIEGYPPPSDPRLKSFSITPDPGVIEVNLPPASDWDELQRINCVVAEEARRSRLTAERFMFDGKHTTTGGGNHIVIGGTKPSDSPLLRRPDLLRSMVAFWQNHPSLSYLFSGRFIGPTSQHPRIDEARMDSLYELEIAFTQLPTEECPPWLVDRLFRNLLVDVTGNTHRAEFCIDKLFPPEGSGSRLGLLELRAFEMQPSVKMGLAELLLIRALVAMFWKAPYQGQLIRWGTGLHDRFLLPHFVKQDFFDVLSVLQGAGYPFDQGWFAPHLEFRFPKIGSIVADEVELELRQALEPWHVLGEEASSGQTSRSVDSSLERMQVKVSGFTNSRYLVTCNGRRVPLHPTGTPGEFVGGVRYRAWQPPNCLHPTIPVHTPLQFQILDLWNKRAIGGCAYHVMDPGGRFYSSAPLDAGEAERRRSERFVGSVLPSEFSVPADEELNPSFPFTLDLRWPVPGRISRIGVPAPGA